MQERESDTERAVRERAYFLWMQEGCPHGRAEDHWSNARADEERRARTLDEHFDEEAILDGDPTANLPALLTKDSRGG